MYRLNDHVRLRAIEADESYWIFDLRNGSHYEVNDTAYIILCGVQAGQLPEQIVARLVEDYQVTRDEAEADITTALTKFEQLDILRKEETT